MSEESVLELIIVECSVCVVAPWDRQMMDLMRSAAAEDEEIL